jgi:hypothetical protein
MGAEIARIIRAENDKGRESSAPSIVRALEIMGAAAGPM